MKKTIFLSVFVFLFSTSLQANEFGMRLGPNLGILGLVNNNALHGASTRANFVTELNLDYQVVGRWFATASFHYIYFPPAAGINGYMEAFVPSAGIRLVSFEEVEAAGDFFDKTRWWFSLEGGPYIHQSHFATIIPRGTRTDFGFSAAGGFDTLFHKKWSAGFKTKMHYVAYGPDEYILLQFGPHLGLRF